MLYYDGTLFPIEIRKSASPGSAAVKHFSVLNHATEIGTGVVLCMATDLLPVDKKNWYVPAWLI